MFFTDNTRQCVVVPNTETEIKWRCYQYCLSLISVQFESPSLVTTLGNYAFAKSSSLVWIDLPASVAYIGNGAFQNCTSLTSIKLPPSLTVIGGSAFMQCTSLVSVSLPPSLTSIGDSAFCQCSSLISIPVPLTVSVSIGRRAFYGCSSLVSIALPSSVVYIGSKAFTGCHELNKVVSKDDNVDPLTTWLSERFIHLPIHEACYGPTITKEKLNLLLHKYHMTTETDRMGMTPLHILACNPHSTADLMKSIVDLFPEMTTMKTIQGLTPMDLFLECRNVKTHNLPSRKRGHYSIYEVLGQKVTWADIQYMAALDKNILGEIFARDEKTGLHSFLKAATVPQCELDVIFNMVKSNMNSLLELCN